MDPEEASGEEIPRKGETPEAANDQPEEDAEAEEDVAKDAAILEGMMADDAKADSDKSPPAAPSGGEESTGDDISPPEEPHQETGRNEDTDDDDDANARAFEELVTGELDPETDEEEILDLEEPVDTQEGESSAKLDDEGASASQREGDGRSRIGQDDALDSGQMQGGGLSDEERGDLEKLITGLREASLDGVSPAVMKGLRRQLKITDARVAKLGKMVLSYDRKLKACYEAMRLHQEKTDIMNRRIDALMEAMNNGKRT